MASARVLEKVQELLAAPSIYSGLKAVAEAYVKAVGTDGETAAAKKLLAELREDVQTIDEVLEFSVPTRARVSLAPKRRRNWKPWP